MSTVIRFDVVIVVVIVVVVIHGLDILCCGHRHLSRCAVASLVAPPPLSPRRRHAATTIAAPTPVSLRLSRASGWLLHRHLSRRASASLVVPTPLSLLHHLSRCASIAPAGCRFANYLDVPPSLLSRRLIVALLPLSLRRSLTLRHLSRCAAVSLGHIPSQQEKEHRFARGV